MKNWKLGLFEFKQGLTLDQMDEAAIVTEHIRQFDLYSEKEIVKSLHEKLAPYAYDTNVKAFLEGAQAELEAKPLTYELKDLYKRIERKNYGMLYRDPLNRLLNIISLDDDDSKMEHIMTELSVYEWIPEVKQFVTGLTKNPVERQNLKNSGKAENIYTVVEAVDNGHVALIGESWFLLGNNEIKQTILESVVTDEEKRRVLNTMAQALKVAEVDDKRISFQIDENLKLGISTEGGNIYINGDPADKGTTLEDIFNSPIVPYLKKTHYAILNVLKENVDKLTHLDVGLKTTNLLKPHVECYAFNYKDKMYVYNRDARVGCSFFEYESVNGLIRDIQNELDYDMTPFFENKLSKELRHLRGLEDKEQKIALQIKDINESIDELKANEALIAESRELRIAFDNLLIHKHNLTKTLNEVRSQKNDARRRQIV